MANTKDLKLGERIQCLVYGPSKRGKTWGALTFPRPVVMDFDKGIAVARNPEFIKRYGERDIEYEQFTERSLRNGIVTKHNAFDDACKYFDKMMAPDRRDTFDTWIIDSGTTLSEFALNKAIIVLGGSKLSKTFETAQQTGVLMLKQQDWGAERSLTEQFVQMVKDSGKNVVLICHQKDVMDDSGTLVETCPLLTGRGVEAICLMFDEIYYLRVKGNPPNRKHELVTATNGIIRCGSRYGVPDGTPWEYDALKAAIRGQDTPGGPTAGPTR